MMKHKICIAVVSTLYCSAVLSKTVVAPLSVPLVKPEVSITPNDLDVNIQHAQAQINKAVALIPEAACKKVAFVENGYGLSFVQNEVKVKQPNGGEALVLLPESIEVTSVKGPALVAGLEKGDKIIGADGVALNDGDLFTERMFGDLQMKPDKIKRSVTLQINHQGVKKNVDLQKTSYCVTTPFQFEDKASSYLRLAVSTSSKTNPGIGFLANKSWFSSLSRNDQIVLAASQMASEYAVSLALSRAKSAAMVGNVFGTVLALTTGVNTANLGGVAFGGIAAKVRDANVLKPAYSISRHMGLSHQQIEASLIRMELLKKSSVAAGKTFDWPVDASSAALEAAMQEFEHDMNSSSDKSIVMKPDLSSKNATSAESGKN